MCNRMVGVVFVAHSLCPLCCVCVCYEACCVHKRRCTKVVVMSWGGVVFKEGDTRLCRLNEVN